MPAGFNLAMTALYLNAAFAVEYAGEISVENGFGLVTMHRTLLQC